MPKQNQTAQPQSEAAPPATKRVENPPEIFPEKLPGNSW